MEHAEALGNLHYRAGTGARSVAAYLEYWRAELHLGGPQASEKQRLAVIAAAKEEIEARAQARFEAEHDDYNAILVKALADRLAEAFAEYIHQQARADWGYGKEERLTAEELIRERYRGIRPAPGYPACPDHSEKRTLWRLLDARAATGIELTESCAMLPAASVSGYYLSHPQASYFGIGRVNRDQIEDYAQRKGMDVAAVERWLAPNLAYEPKA